MLQKKPRIITDPLEILINKLLKDGMDVSIFSDKGIFQSTIIDKKQISTGYGRTFLEAFQRNEYFMYETMDRALEAISNLSKQVDIAAKNRKPENDDKDKKE